MPSRLRSRTLLALCLTLLPLAAVSAAPPATAPVPPPLDGVEWLAERRDEAQRDRIHAAALAAHARLLFQRQEFDQALRRYQRAWRYSPSLVHVLDEIVPLAFSLNRGAEATRYAVLAAETEVRDPQVLIPLGDFLLASGDPAGAERLYELALRGELPAVLLWSTRLKLGRLQGLGDRPARAAELLDSVVRALDDPVPHGLTAEQAGQMLADPERAYLALGEVFLEAGQADRADMMFARAAEAAGQPALLHWQRARLAARRDDWSGVRKHLDAYLADPWPTGDSQPWELLGRLLRQELAERGEKAARTVLIEQLAARFERAEGREPSPEDGTLALFLARQLEADGQPERAGRVLERAGRVLERAGARQPAAGLLAGQAEFHLRQQQWLPFVEAAGRLMRTEGSLAAIGKTLDQLVKSREMLDAVLAAAREADSAGQLPAGGGLAVGQLAVVGGRYDDAATFYRRALKEDRPEDQDVYQAWGLSLLLADQYGRAAEVFQQALQGSGLTPSAAQLYFYRAGCLALDGRTDAALRDARRAAALRPASAEYRARIAWIHYQAGQDQQARRAYEDLVERFERDASDETRVVLREARRILSNLASREGKIDQAAEWLEQVLDEFPRDAGAQNDLGYLWADAGRHLERALTMTRAAVEFEPDNAAYRDSLGWALHRLGRHAEALEQLRKATETPDTDGVVLDHLGDVCWALGRYEEARGAWRRALEAFERDEDDQALRKAVSEKLSRTASEG